MFFLGDVSLTVSLLFPDLPDIQLLSFTERLVQRQGCFWEGDSRSVSAEILPADGVNVTSCIEACKVKQKKVFALHVSIVYLI